MKVSQKKLGLAPKAFKNKLKKDYIVGVLLRTKYDWTSLRSSALGRPRVSLPMACSVWCLNYYFCFKRLYYNFKRNEIKHSNRALNCPRSWRTRNARHNIRFGW